MCMRVVGTEFVIKEPRIAYKVVFAKDQSRIFPFRTCDHVTQKKSARSSKTLGPYVYKGLVSQRFGWTHRGIHVWNNESGAESYCRCFTEGAFSKLVPRCWYPTCVQLLVWGRAIKFDHYFDRVDNQRKFRGVAVEFATVAPGSGRRGSKPPRYSGVRGQV